MMSMGKLILAGCIAACVGAVAGPVWAKGTPAVKDSNAYRLSGKALSDACTLLDDKEQVARMDGLVTKLATLCHRPEFLGGVQSEAAEIGHRMKHAERGANGDVQVNDASGESGATQTQNETSIARDENTGVLCSGFNDAWSGVVAGGGFTGFARSTDNGQTWEDGGAFDNNSFGDPAMVWRRSDGNFYLATLHNNGLGFYRSTDQCQTMSFQGLAHIGGGDDKEFIVVDNNPSSPYYGRIHMVWINFDAGARIYSIYTDDAVNWTSPIALSASFAAVQGAWPAVAPDGTVYTSWVRFGSGTQISIETVRSTDGGDSWTQVANAASNVETPRDSGASSFCGRTALKGNVRYLPSPQIVVSSDGTLHSIYTYDPDGNSNGNESDVFYRRSTNQGTSWGPEIRLNDDGTETDQYFPTLSVSPTGRLVAAWYDRRLDSNNLMVDYYAATSTDGGLSWEPNIRVSDESSAIYLDPNLASCYHGDYDQSIQDAESVFLQWADDRAIRSGHADPDVYLERRQFAPDFFLNSDPATLAVCAPDDAVYNIAVGQALGFSDPVTLTADGTPAGSSAVFSPNPVAPGSSTELVIGTGGAAAGAYVVDINGAAAALERSTGVILNLNTALPGNTALVAPANLAVDVASPTYSWTAATQGAGYTVEIALDADFSILVDAATVQATSYTSGVQLAPETEYFWRVRAGNACGEGQFSPVFSFTTAALVCNTNQVAIPDNSGSGVDSTSTVAGSGELTDLDVSLRVTHTYVGDLRFSLTHESTGTTVTLIDRPGYTGSGFGCNNDNIDATLDDEASLPVENQCESGPALVGLLLPQQPLSAFDGEDFSGAWTLNASDNAGVDTGTVNEWCLRPTFATSAPDTDSDGLTNDVDNCTLTPNVGQIDADGDGIGNACDADLNNDCVVNFLDLGQMKLRFFSNDPVADLDSNGSVNFLDLAIMKASFFGAPGPAASPNDCD